MSNSRMRKILLLGLMALAAAACTRAASTPPPEEAEEQGPVDSQQATMEAVRSALLTQTAQAQESGPAATAVPTQAPAAETPAAEMQETAQVEQPPEYVEYTVKAGDWLFMIAASFGVDPQAIIELNGLTSPSDIAPGKVLKIPPSSGALATPSATTIAGGTLHVVKPGEWIWQIARIYGVDPQEIIDANDLANPALIYPGMELVIP